MCVCTLGELISSGGVCEEGEEGGGVLSDVIGTRPPQLHHTHLHTQHGFWIHIYIQP